MHANSNLVNSHLPKIIVVIMSSILFAKGNPRLRVSRLRSGRDWLRFASRLRIQDCGWFRSMQTSFSFADGTLRSHPSEWIPFCLSRYTLSSKDRKKKTWQDSRQSFVFFVIREECLAFVNGERECKQNGATLWGTLWLYFAKRTSKI